jgi:hypothetical protein
MFGKGGFVKRVNAAVDAVLHPGEERLMAIYAQGPRRPPSSAAVATSGIAAAASLVSVGANASSQMSSAWLLAITDQRLLVLAMDGLTARSATLAAEFPADAIKVASASKSGFDMAFPDGTQIGYRVLPAWRREAAQFLEYVPNGPPQA